MGPAQATIADVNWGVVFGAAVTLLELFSAVNVNDTGVAELLLLRTKTKVWTVVPGPAATVSVDGVTASEELFPDATVMLVMANDALMVLVNVTEMRNVLLAPQEQMDVITAVGAGPETANAGAATLTAAIGAVQAASRTPPDTG